MRPPKRSHRRGTAAQQPLRATRRTTASRRDDARSGSADGESGGRTTTDREKRCPQASVVRGLMVRRAFLPARPGLWCGSENHQSPGGHMDREMRHEVDETAAAPSREVTFGDLWHSRRLLTAAVIAISCLILNSCGGGGGGSGGSTSGKPLVWDSGQWDNANWQ
jgi:hypothetical protein